MSRIIKLLSISLLLLSSTSYAGQDRWKGDSVDSHLGPIAKLQLFQNVMGNLNVGIVFPSSECSDFSSEVMMAPSYKINGIAVKASAQCVDKGLRMDFPATRTGMEYLKSQLRTKANVTYEQDNFELKFSAMGFSNSEKDFSRSLEGI
ncbi:hypothetical protein [Photobacterium halotolerans]|uniref:Uncharacterized protein n=1 Tax=Photobacterium halotolerans TaxID=265726 RepID=A0A0F5VH84_9GAMM|nr:hypothetical protein [Photobacterium halotolerans]KKD01423.1 hypothetical protein KY46_00915 [Photobacterium halotolerans]